MSFLDALRIQRRHIEKKIDLSGKHAACLSRKTDEISAAGSASLYAADYVRACTAGRERHENVLRSDEGFDLTRENVFESVVVTGCGEHRGVGSERKRREAATVGSQPHDKFSREVQCIGCASTISEEDDFSAAAQDRRTFFSKLCDAPHELVRKTPLHASAFLELASYFFGG